MSRTSANSFTDGPVTWHAIYLNDFGEALIWEAETPEGIYRVQVDEEDDCFRLSTREGDEQLGVFDDFEQVKDYVRELFESDG